MAMAIEHDLIRSETLDRWSDHWQCREVAACYASFIAKKCAGLMAVSFLALLFASCGGGGDTAGQARNLSGIFTLSGYSSSSHPQGDGGFCFGKGGYDDIQTGLRVVVTNGDGKTLATGSLGESKYNASEYDCAFPIVITTPLPKADFYSVEVGSRGKLTYSYDEMAQRGWTVAFTLG